MLPFFRHFLRVSGGLSENILTGALSESAGPARLTTTVFIRVTRGHSEDICEKEHHGGIGRAIYFCFCFDWHF